MYFWILNIHFLKPGLNCFPICLHLAWSPGPPVNNVLVCEVLLGGLYYLFQTSTKYSRYHKITQAEGYQNLNKKTTRWKDCAVILIVGVTHWFTFISRILWLYHVIHRMNSLLDCPTVGMPSTKMRSQELIFFPYVVDFGLPVWWVWWIHSHL